MPAPIEYIYVAIEGFLYRLPKRRHETYMELRAEVEAGERSGVNVEVLHDAFLKWVIANSKILGEVAAYTYS